MRKFKLAVILGVTVALVSSYSVYGQNQSGKSFLWEIIPPNGKSSFLLGSVHMMKKEHYPLKQIIEDSFAKSDVLALEIDITGGKMLEMAGMMLQKATLPEGKTLKDVLSADTIKKLEQKTAQLSLSFDFLKNMQPWMAAMMIQQFEMAAMGFDAFYGIDMHFAQKAEALKKEVAELEGAEFQVNLFNGLSSMENESFLLASLKQSEQNKKEFARIINAWQTGDAAEINSLMVDYVRKDPETAIWMKKFLDDRNVLMAEKILQLLGSGKSIFVVVGAAHMVGQKGLVQLLRDRGYKVVQR